MSYFDDTGIGRGHRPGSRSGDESIELEAIIEHETPKAYLLEFTNGSKEWCPKSQVIKKIEAGINSEEKELWTFTVKEWWAKKAKLV